MKNKKIPVFILGSLFAIAIVTITMISYIDYVQESLWDKSVDDILETTSQEEKSLNIYLQKDTENLRNVLNNIVNSKDHLAKKIAEIPSHEYINYFYIDTLQNKYIDKTGEHAIDRDKILQLSQLYKEESGIIDPFFNDKTGIKVIGTYVRDEHRYLIKESQVSYIADKFSLSFYNNLGFSYIVNTDGDVLIRTNHKNANRTFQNLFDIIDLEKNNNADIESFKNSLAHQQKGIALFNYHDNTNVFCYVPMSIGEQWYVVSIIPNAAIMEQANNIILHTIVLSLIIIGSIGFVVLLYLLNHRKHKRVVENLAFYDHLTGLYNYQKFKMEGQKLLAQENRSWAVIYIDIDGFKIINDLNGYQFGDFVLKELAALLEKYVTEYCIACHMNADQFLFMCHYHNKKDIVKICQEINQDLRQFLHNNGYERETVMKFGICCQEDDKHIHTMDHLVDCSHLALNALSHNVNEYYYFYHSQMREHLLKEADIESKMDKALENKEFVFFLQPKFNVNGEKILGAEALVRWIDSQQQMIMPNDFIPFFEKNGFILKLDEYVFESVCQYMSSRISQHQNVIPISVNISRLHLYQHDFIERYVKIKEKYQIPDQLLELEITENILLEDVKRVQTIVAELQAHGFLCSIDDFGSGYSSLNLLKDLPINVIKLDRFFLKDNYNVVRSYEIIKSVINMAKSIDIYTVAEGVETKEQQQFLQTIGCDMIQGYIFSKPLPIDEFNKYL